MYYKHGTSETESITIRPARPADADAVARLAERDSADVPAGELLVAAVGDEIRAAIAVAGGIAIADPFHPTEALVRLLTARALQLRSAQGLRGLRRLAARLPRGRRRAGLSPQPAGTVRAFN